MGTRAFFVTVGVATSLTAAGARQHEGHSGIAAGGPDLAQVAQCRQAQPAVAAIIEAAVKRIEDARLTNSAAAMRDAADDLQVSLIDIRNQLGPCSRLQTAAPFPAPLATPSLSPSTGPAAAPPSAEPHGGHSIPAAASTGANAHAGHATPAAASTGADAHAGHAMPAAASTSANAHAGHLTPPAASSPAPTPAPKARATASTPPTNIAELKCANGAESKTVPRMLYQGRMYYFCTMDERAQFAKDPARYVTEAPAAPPAHAH